MEVMVHRSIKQYDVDCIAALVSKRWKDAVLKSMVLLRHRMDRGCMYIYLCCGSSSESLHGNRRTCSRDGTAPHLVPRYPLDLEVACIAG